MKRRPLQDKVERWLTHYSYHFSQVQDRDGAFFNMRIRHAGGFGNAVDIFEPKGQPGVLVVGSKVQLGAGQNARYLKLSEAEQGSFEEKAAAYCRSIRAVCRFSYEDGRKKIGVYVVLDGKEPTESELIEAVVQASELADKAAKYLAMSF